MNKLLLLLLMVCLPVGARPLPWQARAGQSGGFTGGGSYLSVFSDGRVTQTTWSDAGAPKKERPVRTLPKKDVLALEKILNDPALLAVQHNQPSNMTSYLEVQAGKVIRRYAWGLGSTPPAPLRRAYDAVNRAAARK